MITWSLIIFILMAITSLSHSDKNMSRIEIWSINTKLDDNPCLRRISSKLTSECINESERQFSQRPRDMIILCCRYRQIESCLLKISKEECGKEVERTIKEFMDHMITFMTPKACINIRIIDCLTVTDLVVGCVIIMTIIIIMLIYNWYLKRSRSNQVSWKFY